MPPPPPLTSRITSPTNPDHPSDDDEIDIFASSLATLFPDDVQSSHGVPGSHVVYRSPRFGDVTLHIPAHPAVEEGRKLFAHYLWNAGVLMAEGVEWASWDGGEGGGEDEERGGDLGEDGGGGDGGLWDRRYWDVRGRTVLELGAGRCGIVRSYLI